MKKIVLFTLLVSCLFVSQLNANCLNEFSATVSMAEMSYEMSVVGAGIDLMFSGDFVGYSTSSGQALITYTNEIHNALVKLCWCDSAWCF